MSRELRSAAQPALDPTDSEKLSRYLVHCRPLLIEGAPGIGKSLAAWHEGRRIYSYLTFQEDLGRAFDALSQDRDAEGRPRPGWMKALGDPPERGQAIASWAEPIRIDVHEDTEARDLVGEIDYARIYHLVHTEKQPASLLDHFRPGPLVRAMLQGRLFIIEELDRCGRETLFSLLFECIEQRRLYVRDLQQEIAAAPSFNVVITANRGSDLGTIGFPVALLRRLRRISLFNPADLEQLADSGYAARATQLEQRILEAHIADAWTDWQRSWASALASRLPEWLRRLRLGAQVPVTPAEGAALFVDLVEMAESEAELEEAVQALGAEIGAPVAEKPSPPARRKPAPQTKDRQQPSRKPKAIDCGSLRQQLLAQRAASAARPDASRPAAEPPGPAAAEARTLTGWQQEGFGRVPVSPTFFPDGRAFLVREQPAGLERVVIDARGEVTESFPLVKGQALTPCVGPASGKGPWVVVETKGSIGEKNEAKLLRADRGDSSAIHPVLNWGAWRLICCADGHPLVLLRDNAIYPRGMALSNAKIHFALPKRLFCTHQAEWGIYDQATKKWVLEGNLAHPIKAVAPLRREADGTLSVVFLVKKGKEPCRLEFGRLESGKSGKTATTCLGEAGDASRVVVSEQWIVAAGSKIWVWPTPGPEQDAVGAGGHELGFDSGSWWWRSTRVAGPFVLGNGSVLLCKEQGILLWQPGSDSAHAIWQPDATTILSAAMSPATRTLLVGTDDGTLHGLEVGATLASGPWPHPLGNAQNTSFFDGQATGPGSEP